MSRSKLSILITLAILALVAVASAALPVSVTATMTHTVPYNLAPYENSGPYWIVDITAGGNEALPNGIYDGYCADGTVTTTVDIVNSPATYPLYDSRTPALLPADVHSANWNKINYVLNNKQGADDKTLQALFWYYSGSLTHQPGFVYDHAKFNLIKADADANGGSYVPTVGQHYAVILWNPEQVQLAFIEAIVPTTPGPNPVPEFPSLALPIAMMLGIVFVVHVVKGREKE